MIKPHFNFLKRGEHIEQRKYFHILKVVERSIPSFDACFKKYAVLSY